MENPTRPIEYGQPFNENIVIIERLVRVEEKVESMSVILSPLANDVHAIRESIRGRVGFFAGVTATVSVIWVGVFAIVHYFNGGG